MISVLQSKINFVKTKAVFDYYFILSWISVSVWSEWLVNVGNSETDL